MMRNIALFSIVLLLASGCKEKEDKLSFNIKGNWYGYLDEHYVSQPELYIKLTLDGGIVTLSRLFHSYTSGWYDSEGIYTQGYDGVIKFDIQMIPDGLFSDHPDIPKIIITHAEKKYSDLDGELLKLYYTKEYSLNYFNKELRGQSTNHIIWMDRERPRLVVK